MKINIVGGRGVMGKIHARLFEEAGHEVICSGRTSSPSIEEAAQLCDITIISVPISATKEMITRVAPHVTALMDFTGLKDFPLQTMLDLTDDSVEVGGLHPLYGDVDFIKGKTVVFCPTHRSKEKCASIVSILKSAGAIIKEMDAKKHDELVGGLAQVSRVITLETFALLVDSYDVTMAELYALSPAPTKVILDLIARQSREQNDALYASMKQYNPNATDIRKQLISFLEHPPKDIGKQIRTLYGDDFLAGAQERAKRILDFY